MAEIQQPTSQWIETAECGEDEADAALFNARMAELKRNTIAGTNALPPEPEC